MIGCAAPSVAARLWQALREDEEEGEETGHVEGPEDAHHHVPLRQPPGGEAEGEGRPQECPHQPRRSDAPEEGRVVTMYVVPTQPVPGMSRRFSIGARQTGAGPTWSHRGLGGRDMSRVMRPA